MTSIATQSKKTLRSNAELCTGCHICELVCSMRQVGVLSPYKAAIRVACNEAEGTFAPSICRHCTKPLCKDACPIPQAMYFSRDLPGVVAIDKNYCIGCLACADACPFGAIQVSAEHDVFKCDLCHGDPLCVKYCPDRPEIAVGRRPLPEGRALEYVESHNATRFRRNSLSYGHR